jgi:hypothetical protein
VRGLAPQSSTLTQEVNDMNDTMSKEAERTALSAQIDISVHVELIDAHAVKGHREAWVDLVSRRLEANVFLEPAFLLPLLDNIPSTASYSFLMAWDVQAGLISNRLLGLIPIRLPSFLHPLPVGKGLDHNLTAQGTPLLDAQRGIEAFEAMLFWLGRARLRLKGLCLSSVPTAGPFWTAVLADRRFPGHAFRILDQRDRAVLRHGVVAPIPPIVSSKKRKGWTRQRRRLSELGTLEFHRARTPIEIAQSAEQFLALEAGGWKGRLGTALAVDSSLSAFALKMMRGMAIEGNCYVDSLRVDGTAVAMGIVIKTGDHAYFWKTAFDEKYRQFSPGVQLALDLTAAQVREDRLVQTDSCAVSDHPMIESIWCDRMGLVDALFALQAPPSSSRLYTMLFAAAGGIEIARRILRFWAKRTLVRIKRAKARIARNSREVESVN